MPYYVDGIQQTQKDQASGRGAREDHSARVAFAQPSAPRINATTIQRRSGRTKFSSWSLSETGTRAHWAANDTQKSTIKTAASLCVSMNFGRRAVLGATVAPFA